MPATADTVRTSDLPHANIALVQNGFSALRRRDLDACAALLAPDFIINLAGMPFQMRGPAAWRRNAEVLFAAFPDVQIHVDDIFATGDKVAVRARLTGTHTGPFLGNPPTGKRFEYQSNEFYRIAGGKIAEEWICSDMLTLMTQIGAIPARHLMLMWLAGFRVWIAAGSGLVIGAALMLLWQLVRA